MTAPARGPAPRPRLSLAESGWRALGGDWLAAMWSAPPAKADHPGEEPDGHQRAERTARAADAARASAAAGGAARRAARTRASAARRRTTGPRRAGAARAG